MVLTSKDGIKEKISKNREYLSSLPNFIMPPLTYNLLNDIHTKIKKNI